MAPSSKVTKVQIDKRFSKMLKDSSFNATSSIDRYGRKVDPNNFNNELKEYYYMEDEKEESYSIVNDSQAEGDEGDDKKEGISEWMQNYDE